MGMDDPAMSTSLSRVRLPSAPVLGWLVAMSCLVVGLGLIATEPNPGRGGDATAVVLAISSSAVGAFILMRRPRHGIGRVCLAAGILVSLGIFGNGLAEAQALTGGAAKPVYWLILSLATLAPILGFVLIGPVLLGMYPTGAFTPTGRRMALLALALTIPLVLITVFGSSVLTLRDLSALNPLWFPVVPSAAVGIPAVIFIVGYVLGIALASASLVIRYRTSSQLERLQIRWVALNGIAIVVFIVLV